MPQDRIETPWLTTEEAATYMRRSPNALKRWRWKGGGPRYYKQGQGPHAPVVYDRAEIDAFIRSESRYSTSDLPHSMTRPCPGEVSAPNMPASW